MLKFSYYNDRQIINELMNVFDEIKLGNGTSFLNGELTVDYQGNEVVINYNNHTYKFTYDYLFDLPPFDFAYILHNGDAPYYSNVANKSVKIKSNRKFRRLISR